MFQKPSWTLSAAVTPSVLSMARGGLSICSPPLNDTYSCTIWGPTVLAYTAQSPVTIRVALDELIWSSGIVPSPLMTHLASSWPLYGVNLREMRSP